MVAQTWTVIGFLGVALSALIALLFAQLGRIDALGTRIDTKIDALDAKFEGKIDALDAKFEGKIDALDAKFEARFDALSLKIDQQGARIDNLTLAFAEHVRHAG